MNRTILIFACVIFCFLSCDKKTEPGSNENILYGTSWKGKVFTGINREYIYDIYMYFDNKGKSRYILYELGNESKIEDFGDFRYLYTNNVIDWDKGDLYKDNFISRSFWSILRIDNNQLILVRDKDSPIQDLIEMNNINSI